MSMHVTNYNQFYKGAETLEQYGNGAGGKDTLARYEFHTTDADGNKVMDKMSKEETMNAMNDISSQYGDNVIVEFSGDGLAKLVEEGKGLLNTPFSEAAAARRAEQQTAFDKDVVQKKNTHPVAASGDNYAGQNAAGASLKAGVILQDDNDYNAMITNHMPQAYEEENGEYKRSLSGISEEADNLFKAYANAYYEIEKGYADGTRVAYVQDDTSETGYRQLTKEEELEKLNNAYTKQVKGFERRNNPKIAEALEENAKKIARIKSSQNKGVTSDTIEELEKRRAELEKLPKDLEKNFFDAAKLFVERLHANKSGMANIADIINGISVFGKL